MIGETEMEHLNTVIVRDKKDGVYVSSMRNLYRLVVSGSETQGSFSVMESIVQPGEGGGHHIHNNEHESFLVTQGVMTFYEGTRKIVASEGTSVMYPPGTARAFRNESNTLVKMMIFYTPPAIENMIKMDGEVISSDWMPSKLDTETQRRIACPKLSREFGIEELDRPL